MIRVPPASPGMAADAAELLGHIIHLVPPRALFAAEPTGSGFSPSFCAACCCGSRAAEAPPCADLR